MRLSGRPVAFQAFLLVLLCVVTTLLLGLGVASLSPPPPPPTVPVAAYVRALSRGADDVVAVTASRAKPAWWRSVSSRPESLIAESIAQALKRPPGDVWVTITAPALLGAPPRPRPGGRGQVTIIDVPPSIRIAKPDGPFSLSTILLNDAVRVPTFLAAIRDDDGTWRVARSRERFPTPWQLRLGAIFVLAMASVAPLAWMGARRWTRPIRSLADRVNRFDGATVIQPNAGPHGSAEVRVLERSFQDLQVRIARPLEERSSMLTAVPHDIRTPLTSLRIRAEDVEGPVRAGMLLDLARVEGMIDGVLAFARSGRTACAL